jgi:hypothetical protein
MKLLGITDENLGCACCGRIDLKRYAVIQDNDGEIATYGSDCATKVLGRKVSTQRSLPKIQLQGIVASESVEFSGYKFVRNYNYITREYELTSRRNNKPITAPLRLVLSNLKESFEIAMEDIEDGIARPVTEMAIAIDWLEQWLNPKEYRERMAKAKAILGLS